MIDSFRINPATVGGGNITSKNTTTATDNTTITYSEFTGKGLSFQYPNGWTINSTATPLATIPGVDSIEMSDVVNNHLQAQILVNLVPLTEEEKGKMNLPNNATEQDIDSRLQQIFPEHMLQPFIKGQTERGSSVLTELGKPVYDKYVVNGHKAGSAIYTTLTYKIPLKTLFIATITGGNKEFMLMYRAPVDIFDRDLPIAENIIKSIVFVNASSNQTDISEQQQQQQQSILQ
ncbi:MAG TPA: hypothetical protein VJ729_14030 [Nitrososphaeraceae archaeon]|nr:hypothetical protein [Nitrososphaeraceae archaeon]